MQGKLSNQPTPTKMLLSEPLTTSQCFYLYAVGNWHQSCSKVKLICNLQITSSRQYKAGLKYVKSRQKGSILGEQNETNNKRGEFWSLQHLSQFWPSSIFICLPLYYQPFIQHSQQSQAHILVTKAPQRSADYLTTTTTTTTKNEVMLFAIYSFTSFSLNHFCLYHQYQMLVSETRHFSRFLGWSEIFDVIVFTVGQHKWCTVGWEEI